MLFSVGMTAYSFYMVRMRPGKMFKSPISKAATNALEKLKRVSPHASQRTSVDHDNMVVIVSKGKGDISIERSGRLLNAEEGLELKYKDKVLTGKSSVAIIQFAGNSTFKLFSNSELHIHRIQHQDRSDTGTQYNIFHLEKGAIIADFVNRGKMHFLEVTSNSGKFQISGTQFLLVHNPKKERSQLAVLEGMVKTSSVGTGTSRMVMESNGVLVKAQQLLKEPISNGWVEKIKWTKLAKGSGIDLYDPNAPQYEIEEWKKRRVAMQKMPVQMQMAKGAQKAGKTKAGGILKNVMGKAAQNMQNLEQAQKDRMKALDSLE